MRVASDSRGPSFGWLDHVLCWALVALASAWVYHPYFFGDEIIQFNDLRGAPDVLDALRRMSSYKPRLVYNSIWAWGVFHDWGRWQFAIVSAAGMAAVCSLAALLATRWFGASRLLAWLLVAGIMTSRFAAMQYFDYIAGIIESLSLALFLAAIWMAVLALRRRGTGAAAASVLLALASTLVHERYIAATFATGLVIAGWALLELPRGERLKILLFALALALLPVASYLGLHELLSDRSLAVGTAGQEVSVDLATFRVFLGYMANVLLGVNVGHPWLVGSLNVSSIEGRLWASGFAIAFFGAWVWFAASIRSDRAMVGRAIALLAIMCALAVMASLPGEARQEGRWLHPVATLAALLALCTPRTAVRYVLLSLFLLVSLVHWVRGSPDTLYNLSESRNARNISQGITRLRPQAGHGVVFGMDYSPWTFGHSPDAVAEFSRRNLGGRPMLELHRPGDEQQQARADIGFVRITPVEYAKGAQFAAVTGLPLRILLEPDQADSHRGHFIDRVELVEGGEWDRGWHWSRPLQVRTDGVVLEPADRFSGHRRLSAAGLDGRVIAYRARLLEPGPTAKMRLQVNWLDAEGRFLDTMIRVVEVDAGAREHRAMLAAPAGASDGLVYATLHDGESHPVLLESISLATPLMTSLAPGGDWTGWRWDRAPRLVEGEGVVLEAVPHLVGTYELDADMLDGRVLVYRARTLQPGSDSPMRLQVNWTNPAGEFLGTQIQVVDVGATSANHPLLLVAPAGAARGVVYANLHDGAQSPVLLQDVDIVRTR